MNFAISDNASNATTAFTRSTTISGNLQWKDYGYYVYKFNLVVQPVSEAFEESISKIKTEKLDQQQINKNKTPKRLIQEVRFTEL